MRNSSRTLRVAIRSLVLALLCSGTIAGATGTASAEPVESVLDYRCAVPHGPSLTVRAQVRGGLPAEGWGFAPNTVPNSNYAYIDVDLTLGGDRRALGAGAVRIDGDSTATLAATFTGPSGTQTADASLTFAPVRLTGWSGAPVQAAGAFTPLFFRQSGDHTIHLGDLKLTLRPERADGTPLGTVGVTCSPVPNQDTSLGSLSVQSVIIERPVRPTELRVTAVTPTSVSLAWHAVPWWFETRDYEVHLDGQRVAYATEKQITLTGLAPDSQHRVKIVHRDLGGFSSVPSQGLVFATPPADL
ncbi:hypothetical protein ALI22I_46455 [Saccharothrix sp. ALI-22-I]|uniref:fibronectin type III domain-containing protein n=1 Tax=Saccharothrix sp. ALI-22-I TaxID=1933778 RepID=UPI00097BBD6C|nr:fibronectin type III domain-containing protein [Saccharothrix sp. ALI-22-I]ONI80696.1 hypothetical protein ALI22I_46455 [Saccharothrix sp. ALI-22-I]